MASSIGARTHDAYSGNPNTEGNLALRNVQNYSPGYYSWRGFNTQELAHAGELQDVTN